MLLFQLEDSFKRVKSIEVKTNDKTILIAQDKDIII